MSKKRLLKDIYSFKERLNFGQKSSDAVTGFCGSWTFILSLVFLIVIWILLNGFLLFFRPWDPYPFILLNFFLSSIAALQAPVILMSQNRQTEKDRIRVEYDYKVDRKAEKEIEQIMDKLDKLERIIISKKR